MLKQPVYYLFLYKSIRHAAHGRKVIPTADILAAIGIRLRSIPKIYRYIILKEMEEMNLIKRVDSKKYYIIGGQADAQLNKCTFVLWSDSESSH